jgi:hypothetical protein
VTGKACKVLILLIKKFVAGAGDSEAVGMLCDLDIDLAKDMD